MFPLPYVNASQPATSQVRSGNSAQEIGTGEQENALPSHYLLPAPPFSAGREPLNSRCGTAFQETSTAVDTRAMDASTN